VTALLLLLALQEDPQPWIDDLSKDDITARETAGKKLVDIGIAALPKLEKLGANSGGELRERVLHLMAAILLNEKRAVVMRSDTKVTIDLKETPLRDAMKRLQEASGFEVWVDEAVDNRPVTLALKDLPYLDALTRICRAHGALRIKSLYDDYSHTPAAFWRMEKPGRARFTLVAGKSTHEPMHHIGPFRVSVSAVAVYRLSQAHVTEFSMTVAALWPPNLAPIGVENLVVDVLQDGQGRSLIPPNGLRSSEAGSPADGPADRLWDMTSSISLAKAPDTKTLSRYEGRLPLWFAARRDKVRINTPASRVNEAIQVGDYSIKIASIEGGEIEIVATMIAGTAWPRKTRIPTLGLTARFFDESGAEIVLTSSFAYAPGKIKVPLKKGQSIAAIEVTGAADLFRLEVPFQFKDVPIPQWP